ncbi:hypothetical protein DFH06DRAFT_1352148 [Mycena polygramma]|nr:hypothetical protein DFH06DRAFT_1352148 [Mycena polygramma]
MSSTCASSTRLGRMPSPSTSMMDVAISCNDTERVFDASIPSMRELEEKGDIVTSTCSTFDLLELYTALEEPEDSLRADSAEDDFKTLDSAHFWDQYTRENPRRSSRLVAKLPSNQPLPPQRKRRPNSVLDNRPVKSQRMTAEPHASSSNSKGPKNKSAWLDQNNKLLTPDSCWTSHTADNSAVMDWKSEQFSFVPPSNAPLFPSEESPPPASKKKHQRRGKNSAHRRGGTKRKLNSDGTQNPAHLAQMVERTFERADAMVSTSYSIVHDAPVTSTGWHGIAPSGKARALVRHKFQAEPDAKQLHPYICGLHPVPYRMAPEVTAERATFLVDREDRIILFRSYRPQWLMDSIDQVNEMVDTLVGRHLSSHTLRKEQSAKADVDAFLALPITKRIIKWVSSVVKLVFPGVAASFEKEAAIILEMYGIAPQFGLFWNFCLNAALEGQDRIHCDPHADKLNRIGICALLIHILKGGERFNHFQRTWLVIWEAGVAIQLPPWVLALYPSALFYHFNIDIDKLEFVWTEGNVDWPTRNNSRPVVAGDEWGRGSMVFFNQSTMTQTAFTGYPTIKAAKLAGHSGTTDYGTDAQAAFSKHVVFVPVDKSS